MLEVKAALQRDLGRLEKWPDRDHTGSSKGRYKALPQDGQTPGMKTSWERVLQKRPWGTKSFHQFGATVRLPLPCSAAGAITRVGGEVTSTVSCAAATAIKSGFVSAACLPHKPGQALGRVLVGGKVAETQLSPSPTEVLYSPALKRGRAGGDVPARPEQRGVQEVRPVGGSNDKHLSAGMKAVELSQELRDNSAGNKMGYSQPGPGKALLSLPATK